MKNVQHLLLLQVILLISFSSHGQKTVAQLKIEFDEFWAGPEGKKELMNYVTTDGAEQQYYYANWNLNGLVNMWQATGEIQYFNEAKAAIDSMISNASDIEINEVVYKGWPALAKDGNLSVGKPLWDSMIWKEVATLLRIVHQSSDFKEKELTWFKAILDWTEKNIWSRYENRPGYGVGGEDGNQFMYTPTDTSHWARIAMELYIITRKPKYKDFFDRASFTGCCTCTEATKGFSMRDQLYQNEASELPAYGMYAKWGIFNNEDKKVDTPHFAAFVQFVALAYQSNMHWTKFDIEKLISTINNIVWKSDFPLAGSFYINGSGKVDAYAISQGAQAILGRFDESFQQRLEATTTEGWNKGHRIGLIAANRSILSNGKLHYGDY